MSQLPAKINRVWSVDPAGVAVERHDPPKSLTKGWRHFQYRLGLIAAKTGIYARGFVPNAEESSVGFSCEKKLGNRYLWIDVKLTQPEHVAFVTSYQGYAYKKESAGKALDGQELFWPQAKVTTATDLLNCSLMLQVNISTSMDGTCNPVFIPLPDDLEQPARYVLENIAGIIAAAGHEIPLVREAFSADALREVAAMPLPEASCPAGLL